MSNSSPLSTCSFDTGRLHVGGWHSLSESTEALAETVTQLLTETTTRGLPWEGDFDLDRAAAWIVDRDAESPTLLVIDRERRTPLGLVIVDTIEQSDALDVRLGYVFAEDAWGQGYASELVSGFVDWCRIRHRIGSITAGVSPDNVASSRVLTKAGFDVIDRGEELIYRITFHR